MTSSEDDPEPTTPTSTSSSASPTPPSGATALKHSTSEPLAKGQEMSAAKKSISLSENVSPSGSGKSDQLSNVK